jgi:hypothetical protein
VRDNRKIVYILETFPFKFAKIKDLGAEHWWLTPVILVTQEAEIRRIEVQSQPPANSSQDPISKIF